MNFDRFLLRSPDAKGDLEATWLLPDLVFFSSAACHILASAFLQQQTNPDFNALLIKPAPGFRGTHVVAANADTIFDAAGYADRRDFLDEYRKRFETIFDGWAADVVELHDDPAGVAFCEAHGHRRPEAFFHDPRPRALRFLRRLGLPAATR